MKVLLTLVLLMPMAAWAEEVCDTAQPLEGQRLLRRLSLDLRGSIPSRDEIEAQVGKPAVDPAPLLASPDFVAMMRRHHAALLWPNIDQVTLVPDMNVLIPVEVAPGDVLWLSPLRSVFSRTISGALYGLCKNEPATFDGLGRVIAEPLTNAAGEILAYQEGYVMVEPWWAPGTSIKVCGFDAQPAESAPACPGPPERYPFLAPSCEQATSFADAVRAPFAGNELECNGPLALFAPGCGCGPNLRYCQSAETLDALRQSFLEQELRVVDRIVSEGRPYHEILTTPVVEMNGLIAHFLREQSRLDFDLYAEPDPTSPIAAELGSHEADRWVTVNRSGRHAGVLTTPGYLLRFGSNRGRAHRFYNAFECSSFLPAGSLPSPFEPCSQREDLTQRCGCNSCHQGLEPMAAAWGRFAEYGLAPIEDARYPARAGANCRAPFTSLEQVIRCARLYETDPVGDEIPYAGMLHGYVFRTPEQVEVLEVGPRALVERSLTSGAFATCTVRRMWTHFMRRAPTVDEEASVVPVLRAEFETKGYDLRGLVASIVNHPAYRRLP